jgi:hypothetical protein
MERHIECLQGMIMMTREFRSNVLVPDRHWATHESGKFPINYVDHPEDVVAEARMLCPDDVFGHMPVYALDDADTQRLSNLYRLLV